MTRYFTAALLAIFSLAIGSAANAVVVQWTVGSGGNDHYYEFVATELLWVDARGAATSSTHLGLTGYLATVTSQAEEDFLLSLAHSEGWLGGTDQGDEGKWIWADGPEAGQMFWDGGPSGTAHGFASWWVNQPDNAGAGEDYLDLRFGEWNDLNGNFTRTGYYAEYNRPLVPEPSTFGLLGLGLLGIGLIRRKRRS